MQTAKTYAMVLLLASPAAAAYQFNPLDFATSVISYTQGQGVPNDFISGQPFNNPNAALGRPTVDTTGDGFFIPVAQPAPVVPVASAFRASELVTVGRGGQLTLRFDRRIENDPANPFGMDFIIFGNPITGSSPAWTNGDPAAVNITTDPFAENGVVSVSQDGQLWHTFTNGPFADSFAPTLGRVYDPANPDASIGSFNQWWGVPTNPTLPLDPAITNSTLIGKSIAEAAQLYGQSTGGTGFDLANVALDWVQFVRIENAIDSNVSPDIDAVADVVAIPEPGCFALLSCASLMLVRQRRRRA